MDQLMLLIRLVRAATLSGQREWCKHSRDGDLSGVRQSQGDATVIVRLDFGDEVRRPRTLRVGPARGAGVHIVAQLGQYLPFKQRSVDELFLGRSLAHANDLVAAMTELWRVSKPGAILRLRLPHASSSWAVSRDPKHRGHFTLETFSYFDPREGDPACPGAASFRVEQARLYLTAPRRAQARGLAVARGVIAPMIEAFVNQNRGMQYRWERWFAPLVGGFEEFAVVLSAVKEPSFA